MCLLCCVCKLVYDAMLMSGGLLLVSLLHYCTLSHALVIAALTLLDDRFEEVTVVPIIMYMYTVLY